ncbi:TPA: DUF551 domain-containing protein [Klebsiella pneumoniae]|nr:DUF551 domain-containing protein [Klebsiella pneumoniae]
MTKSTITRERLEEIVSDPMINQGSEFAMMARMALAAMDSSESVELPLDYLQGHKDGLEWAARLAEANHPETGDWLYDDPIELAKAIRKGPDMPPSQPVADSEPVIVVGDDGGDALSYRRLIQSFEPGTKLYLHAQPAPVVPTFDEWLELSGNKPLGWVKDAMRESYDACRAAMFAAAKHDTPAMNSVQSVVTVPGKWIPVREQMPESKPGSYEYLVFETLNNRVNHDYWNVPDKGDDAFAPFWNYYGGHVTHWMPLPAAPKEAQGE